MDSSLLNILLLLILSGFFSGSESALFSLKWWQLHQMSQRRNGFARLIIRTMETPRRLLVTILLGNTLVNVAASSLAENYFERTFPGSGMWLAIAVMTILLLIFGEITPKTIALHFAERFSMMTILPLKGFSVLLFPVRIVLEKFADLAASWSGAEKKKHQPDRESILSVVREGEKSGIMTPYETRVVENMFDMEAIEISRVMIPRPDVLALPEDVSLNNAVQFFLKHDIRRIPIYRDSLDTIIGVLYAKDVLHGWFNRELNVRPADIARPPFFVPYCISLKELYYQLKTNKMHMAIVLNEYGGTAGLITHDDILENLLGSVTGQENGISELIRETSENVYLVSGRIDLEDLSEIVDLEFDSDHFHTLNGFILDKMGHIPKAGEAFRMPEYLIRIVEATDKEVVKVRIRKLNMENRINE